MEGRQKRTQNTTDISSEDVGQNEERLDEIDFLNIVPRTANYTNEVESESDDEYEKAGLSPAEKRVAVRHYRK